MNFTMKEVKSFKILAMRKHGKGQDNSLVPMLWMAFKERIQTLGLEQEAEYIGYGEIQQDFSETGDYSYAAGIKIKEITKIPEGMEVIEIPDNNYGVFRIDLKSPEKIPQTMQEIYTDVIPNAGYQPCAFYDFEVYSPTMEYYMHYIPLQKK